MYDVLGVSKTASPDEIKKAYRKLILKFHPDKPTGDAEKFKKVQEAYETLSDPQKRQNFDQFGTADGPPQGPPGGFPPDIFAQMFAGGANPFGFPGHQRGPRRRADAEHTVVISLEQAFKGVNRTMRVTLQRPCKSCQSKCGQCGGRGQVHQQMGPFAMAQPCGQCEGQGKTCTGCQACQNQKKIFENLNFELRIPKGVETGTVMTAHGLGEQARDSSEESGNLNFHIRVEDHPIFMRQGKDLIFQTKISFEDSVQGKVLSVPHFDGTFEVDTAQWGPLDPRQDYVIPFKGMQEGGRLRLSFDVQYPGPSPSGWRVTQLSEPQGPSS